MTQKSLLQKKRILVADDDPAILDSVKMLLEDEGYIVEVTANGETVKKLQNDLPNLLILDIWMSGIDGRTICRYLKQSDSTKHVPIIMFSANKDTALHAKESGANDFLEKPFEIDELLGKVKKNIM